MGRSFGHSIVGKDNSHYPIEYYNVDLYQYPVVCRDLVSEIIRQGPGVVWINCNAPWFDQSTTSSLGGRSVACRKIKSSHLYFKSGFRC